MNANGGFLQIAGFKQEYINSLSAEQKNDIHIVIPASVNSKPVLYIGAHAFYSWHAPEASCCKGIFQHCRATSLTFVPTSNVRILGAYSFSSNLFTTVTLPDSITETYTGVFESCKNLISANIPKGIVAIGPGLYNNCTQLEGNLTFPETLKSVGHSFASGSKLSAIYLNSAACNTMYYNAGAGSSTTGSFDDMKGAKLVAKTKSDQNIFNATTHRLAPYGTNSGTAINSGVNYVGTQQLTCTENMTKVDLQYYSGIGETWGAKQTLYFNSQIVRPTDTPTKQGYTFKNWYTEPVGGTLFDFEKLITANTDIYAQWNVNQYSLTFDSKGGSAVGKITQDFGTAVTKPTDPTRPGYAFGGWYTDETFNTPYTFGNMGAANKTLYAKWISKYTFTEANNNLTITGFTATYLNGLGDKLNILIDIPSTIEGKNVGAVGAEAFKQSKYVGYNFVGVTFDEGLDGTNFGIGTDAYAGCDKITGQLTLPKGSNVGQNAFGGCLSLSGVLTLPQGVTVLSNAFVGTNFSAIYLPSSAAPTSVYNDGCFDGTTSLLICKDYIDYNSYMTLSNLNLTKYSSRLTYEVVVKFNGGSGSAIDNQIKLFNQSYKYVQKDDVSKVWTLDSGYELPFEIKAGYTLTCCQDGSCKDSEGCTHAKISKDSVVLLTGQAGSDTVYAKYSAHKYVINFDGNGGTGEAMPPCDMVYDVAKKLPTSTYTKPGYAFGGWNTQADGKGISVLIEDTITNELETCIINGKVTLYAMWAAGTYTITFDANAFDVNGGADSTLSGEVRDKEMTYGEAKYLLADDDQLYARAGYTFAGWSTKNVGTKEFDFNAKVNGKSIVGAEISGTKIKFYAVWTPNTYFVNFDKNGGTGNMNAQPMAFDRSSTINLNTFSKTDYIFVGWSKSVGGTVIDFADGEQGILNLSSEPSAEVTLYACWEKMFLTSIGANDTIIITGFNPNYLNSLTAEQKKNIAIKIPATLDGKDVTAVGDNAFEASKYDGCIFVSVDFASAPKLSRIGASAFLGCTGLKTLKIPPTVTEIGASAFRNCGGLTDVTFSDGMTATYGTDIFNNCTKLANVKFAEEMTEIPQAMFLGCTSLKGILTIPNKVGSIGKYAFQNCTAITGLNILGMITTFGESAFEGCTELKGSLDLRNVTNVENAVGAKAFAGTKFEYIMLPNQSTSISRTAFVNTGATLLICEKTSYDGYKSGLTDNVSQLTYEVELTFNVEGQIENIEKVKKLFNQSYLYTKTADGKWTINKDYTLPTPDEVVGHTFGGWFNDDKFVDDKIDVKTNNVTSEMLYAKETPIKYEVTFNLGDGKPSKKEQVDYGQKVTRPQDVPIREGYIFLEWCIDDPKDQAFDFANTIVTGNVTIYARWKAVSYNILFDPSGASGKIDPMEFDYDEKFFLPKVGFDKDGYSIVAWTTASNGQGTRYHVDREYSNFMSTDGGTMTLYAVWEKNQYTVTYETNGGSAVPPTSVGHGNTAATPNPPTKAGYTFAGWFSDPQLTKAFVFAGITSNKTAYAKYTVTKYDVIFDGNGGNGTMDGITLVYDEVGNLIENKFNKVGFIFKGWNTKADGTGTFFDNLSEVENLSTDGSAIKLFAVWEKEQIVVSVVVDTGKIEKLPIVYGTKMPNMPDPTKEGYVFAGWFKDEACTEVYNFDDAITEKITIYAKWDKKGLGVGAIVGIAVGSVVGVGAIAAGVAVPLLLKKKKGGAGKATKA